MKINYQTLLDEMLIRIKSGNTVPHLLLHSCCAPCSSYVLEYLSDYFDIDVFYYNPNISPESEYIKRLEEQKRFIREFEFSNKVRIIEAEYDPESFYKAAEGLEKEPERGIRCEKCFRLRLEAAAKKAAELNSDYFTTTLTVSPYKSSEILNEIGGEIGKKYGIEYLFSNFKKRNGYKRSIELSEEYGLYRQNFCGCEFSRQSRYEKIAEKDDGTVM